MQGIHSLETAAKHRNILIDIDYGITGIKKVSMHRDSYKMSLNGKLRVLFKNSAHNPRDSEM